MSIHFSHLSTPVSVLDFEFHSFLVGDWRSLDGAAVGLRVALRQRPTLKLLAPCLLRQPPSSSSTQSYLSFQHLDQLFERPHSAIQPICEVKIYLVDRSSTARAGPAIGHRRNVVGYVISAVPIFEALVRNPLTVYLQSEYASAAMKARGNPAS